MLDNMVVFPQKMAIKIFGCCFFLFLFACSTDNKKAVSVQPMDLPVGPDEQGWPASFGFGEEANEALIKKWNISIAPDGKGLPIGGGSAGDGAVVYQAKCAACHGPKGWDGPFDQLVINGAASAKTIGNYWPYTTTIFDYIRRAMPYNAPGSLSNEEVYQLTAFLLYANGIISKEEEINAKTLPKIEMPAKRLFVPDDRKGGREIR